MTGAYETVRTDFPWASQLALESHLTLLRAHAVYAEVLAQSYGELGLSTARFNLLWLLYRSANKRLTVGELADSIGNTPPSVMKMVQSLDAEGWTTTSKGTSDRRVTFVELSEEGSVRFGALLEIALHQWEHMWGGLTPEEQKTLVSLLAKLRTSLLAQFLGESGLAAFRARSGAPRSTEA